MMKIGCDGFGIGINRRVLLAAGALGLASRAGRVAHASGAGSRDLYEGCLLADYFQIYLRDAAHPELPDDYGAAAIERRLTTGPYAAIVHTARNMIVPVRIDWHDERPAPDLDAFQHVVQTSFDCPSGQIIVAGLTDDEAEAARLSVPSGFVGMRLGISGLDTLSDDGLEGNDRYAIQLWHGREDLRVLKLWNEPS